MKQFATVLAAAAAVIVTAVVLWKLTPVYPPAEPAWSLVTHPRALDRYTRLRRRLLTYPDPRGVYQLMQCEIGRVADALGPDEMYRRVGSASDTVGETVADRRRLGGALGGGLFQVGGPLCDSLSAVADAEDGPIPRAPDSLRAR